MAGNPYEAMMRADETEPTQELGARANANNPYEALIREDHAAQRGALTASALEHADTPPEQFAEALNLGRLQGVPAGVAVKSIPDMKAQARRDQLDRLMRESPTVAGWASAPVNMGVASDDLDTLALFEAVARKQYADLRVPGDVGRSVAQGVVGDFAGRSLEGAGELYDVATRTINRGLSAVGVPNEWLYTEKPPERGSVDFWMNPANWLREPGKALQQAGEDVGPPAERQSFLTDVGKGSGQIAGQVGLALLTGGASLTAQGATQFGSMAAQGASIQAERVSEAGTEGTPAADAAILAGATITAVTERLGLDFLMKRLPPNIRGVLQQRLVDWTIAGGGEAAQEVIEGVSQNLVEGALVNPDAELFKGLEQDATVAGTVGFLARALLGVRSRGRELVASAQDAAKLSDLTTAAAVAKVSERSPEAMESLVTQMRQDGTPVPQTVYLDARRAAVYFQQQGLDPEAEMTALAGSPEAMAEASITGDLKIPMERWLARAAKRKDLAELQPFARTDVDAMTPAELKELDADALLKEMQASRLPAEPETDSEVETDPKALVRETVLGQLIDAGVERSAAELQADLLAQRYQTRAERRGLGESAAEVFGLSGLTIERGEATQPDVDAFPASDAGQKVKVGASQVNYTSDGKVVDITLVSTPKKSRGQGAARAAMREFLRRTDAAGKPVTLAVAEQDKTTDPARLQRFYESLGFVATGETTEGGSPIMRREARAPQVLEQGDSAPVDQMRTPSNPSILEQRPHADIQRGRIELRPGGARIVLTKDQNLSTFLHETGHLWLDELIEDATSAHTDPALAADLDRALAHVGATVRASDGAEAIRAAITTEQHEAFARSAEAYLREGKAPTPTMRDVFARFRAWLVRLYRDIRSLNVELSDEVRGVFDRLIATDDEIAAAEAQSLYLAGVADSPEEAAKLGMTPDEYAAYTVAREKATQEAREDVEQQLIAAWEREAKADYREARAKMRETVEAEVNAQPVYRAILELQSREGPKLSRADLVDHYGEAFLATLPGPGEDKANRGGYVYAADGGMPIEDAGFWLGYDSGDALVQAMVKAPSREAVIEAETQKRMREAYPDPLTDGTISARAQRAVHSEARADVLERELKILAKAAGQKPTQRRVITAVAQGIIDRKVIRNLRPREYLVAERKAARESLEAVAAGTFDVAYRAKFRQALNARLFALATDAEAQAVKDHRAMRRYEKRPLRERIGKAGNGWLEQVDLILSEYSLSTVSGAEIDRQAALADMAKAVEAGLLDVPVSMRSQLSDAKRTNWRSLTTAEMRGLVDTLKQIETNALREYEILLDGELRMIEDDADAVAKSVTDGGRYVEPSLGSKSRSELLAKYGKESLAIWLRPSAIARQADGGNERGAVTRTVIEPIRRAVAEKLEPMKAQAQQDIADLWKRFYSKRELLAMSRHRERIPDIRQDWTKYDLLALALNWGNEQNRAAVLESRANGQDVFTRSGVEAALDRLTKRDWDFVQAAWDYIDTFWPEVSAAQKRRTGIAPTKVEALAFERVIGGDRKGGETIRLRGGYYPLSYDSDTDANVRQDELEDAFKRIMTGRHGKAATARGHTIERVGSGRKPVRMDINVLHRHVSQVIHDLALGDTVDYVYKVLNRGQVKSAFSSTGKLEDWKSLNVWLKDAAAGEMAARTFAEKSFRWIRIGFTKSKLGFNVMTALMQPTGFLQSAVVVGKTAMLRGVTSYLSSPFAAHRQVMDQSAFMRTRYQLGAFNKDVQDTMEALKGKFGLIPSWVGPSMFLMMAKAQLVVDTSTWLAAYDKAKREPSNTHDDAVRYADGVVENAQTSGFFSDRSAIERGTLSDTTRQSEFVRAWTALISYMLAKGNIAYERARGTNYKSIPQVANLLADMGILFAVEGLLVAALRGQMPDEDEDWFWWLAGNSAQQVAATVPFVREVPSAVKGFSAGGGPVGSLINDIGKAWTQAQQDEVDAALLKAANNVGGTLFHYPSAQMNRAVDAYWRENVEGEDVAPYEYLTGRREPR